jgi:tRNA (cmo5U34)-methyltransferase
MKGKDTLYQSALAGPGSFRFDQPVVDVFADMINRSVPGYSLVVPMIGQLARRYALPGTVIHDLGCSLGASSLAMRRALEGRDVRIVATDSSLPMVQRFTQLLQEAGPGVPVDVVHGDVLDTDFRGSSLVVLNFTLQFIAVAQRPALLQRICDALPAGGALVLSEKIRFEDAGEQARQNDWHHDYKRYNGYTELEIARKRTALEAVLLPETLDEHVQRLHDAGFSRVTRWFQCFSFCSFVAEK